MPILCDSTSIFNAVIALVGNFLLVCQINLQSAISDSISAAEQAMKIIHLSKMTVGAFITLLVYKLEVLILILLYFKCLLHNFQEAIIIAFAPLQSSQLWFLVIFQIKIEILFKLLI